MPRRSFLLSVLVFAVGLPAAAGPSFRPLPLSTADQQAAMNTFGNLAVADVITTRCGKSFLPPVTGTQKTALARQADYATAAAKNALHDAYPLQKAEAFGDYLESYRVQEVTAANDAIDKGGCDDPRVQVMITLLSTYLKPAD